MTKYELLPVAQGCTDEKYFFARYQILGSTFGIISIHIILTSSFRVGESQSREKRIFSKLAKFGQSSRWPPRSKKWIFLGNILGFVFSHQT